MEKQDLLNKLAEFLHEVIAEKFDVSYSVYSVPEEDEVHVALDFDDGPVDWESEEVQEILYEIMHRPGYAVAPIEE